MPSGTAPYKNHTLSLTSLTIKKCLGCDHIKVNFSRADNVHVIVYNVVKGLPKDLPAVTPVGQAILLLCTLTYPDADSVSKLQHLVPGDGSVSLDFELLPLNADGGGESHQAPPEDESEDDMEPCTSKQAMERQKKREERKAMREAAAKAAGGGNARPASKDIQVTVERRFNILSYPGSVYVRINGGEIEIMTVADFHKKFFARSVQHSFQFLWRLHQKCAGNWLQVIQGDDDAYSSFKQPDSPFESFVRLFDRQEMAPQDVLCRLATTCLQATETVRLSERRFVLNVFEQVRQIFEYITVNEYTVWFLVPTRKSTDEQQVNLDDFDLTKVRTCIRAAGDTSNIFWNYTDHNIKDILMVSFQLALASYANQSVLVLSHMEKLSEFVTMQYVTASFMNDIYGKRSKHKWICHRYLQRIVNMSLIMGAIVIIEYPSAFTLLRGGRKLIKCFPKPKTGGGNGHDWEIFEGVVKDNESDIQFLKSSVRVAP